MSVYLIGIGRQFMQLEMVWITVIRQHSDLSTIDDVSECFYHILSATVRF